MTKKRQMRLQEERRQQERQSRKSIKSRIFKVITVLATLLGGYTVLVPRVTVLASDPVDSNNPFSASIKITNTGFIPLRSVTPYIAIRKISALTATGKPLDIEAADGSFDVKTYRPDWGKPDLGRDDSFTFALNDVWNIKTVAHFKSADIGIVVDYDIPIVHWQLEKIFPIYARRQSNGNFYWYTYAPPR